MQNNVNLKEAVQQLKGKHVLVTGGAGFIGSNIVAFLLENKIRVSVLDNLSTGKRENIEAYESNDLFNFIEGDITDINACYSALKGVDCVSHQAALGSVPRSIDFPHNTHRVNATGFLNILHAVKVAGIKRFVYASSSSVYGDSTNSPKKIGDEGALLSPYAVTKRLNEEYANVYHKLHGIETVGLRYFNVFGPNQDPNGVYAAAIPKFVDKMRKGEQLTVNGDGKQTRDFTYVSNAVKANVLALTVNNENAFGRAYNVACGHYFTLNSVIEEIRKNLKEEGLYNESTTIVYGPERLGDIRNSLADVSETVKELGYKSLTFFPEGMKQYCICIC